MTGYDYGNARLRARRAALLRREQYAGLLSRDLPGLLAALAETSYRPQAEAAAGASGGQLGLLYRMARDHLATALADVAGFYHDWAGEAVAALLGRFDLHNVLTLLRAAHHGGAEATAGAALLPVGRLDARTAREAASRPDLPAAARLLAGRRLPDPDSAATLLAAAHRYEIDTSLAAVEHAVARSARAHQLRVLTTAGVAAEPAAAALRRETDDLNLLLALRLREAANGQAAGSTPGTAGPPYLPGGTVPDGRFATIQHALARADVLAAAAPAPARWQSPLATWAEEGDLATLHTSLEAERLRAELRLLLSADPLGAAVVVYHVLAHQAQARNIRLLAQAAAGAIGHEAVRHQLITPV
ncbi:MAG TPA: V-type ATPase subunit [Streptosporangiaceae bacterium]|jgi:V/A-type H+-transporting ATPase subunit C|nr:V-type ATPase subunit [Streptosporangiaceae bacterium]